jgi:RNA polymerase sigma-70 factor (ECF subfamily)
LWIQWRPVDDDPGMSDGARFEAFVREYQDMVFGTAVRLVGNPAEAEDVAQSVFLRAFEHFGEIGDSRRAPGWLKTVTRNLCLNHLTRYRRRFLLFSEADPPGPGRDDEGDDYAGRLAAPAAANPASGEDESDRLAVALAALPDRQRVPLVLFHFEDMSYQDIASALGVSLAKVKTDIHRGREALRKELRPAHAR